MRFWKLCGAGNDFVGIDHRKRYLGKDSTRAALVRQLCDRRNGIGADGVLLIEESLLDATDFTMRYYNADGSEGEMCGNGARCIARLAYHLGIAGSRMTFRTMAGPMSATILDDTRVSLEMGTATQMHLGLKLAHVEGEVHAIMVGVPHAVQFVDNVAETDVARLGPRLRYHPDFAPRGANANFVQVRNNHTLEIRTYERGVEAETLACGTGSCAAAIIARHLLLVTPPVHVRTAGGHMLTVTFEPTEDGAEDLCLEGPAVIVYEGLLHGENWGPRNA
jgi:diaminopimelate epimerase